MVSRKFLITTNLIALFLAGCSAKYQCEATKTGVCASVEDVYEATYASGSSERDISKQGVKSQKTILQSEPIFPLREPEKVYRVWVKEYEDENGFLVSNHYIYIVVEGRWKLGAKKKSNTLLPEIYYDRKIKEYLIQKGKIKPPENVEEDGGHDKDI